MTGTVTAGELCVVLGIPHILDLHPCIPVEVEPPQVMGTTRVMGIPPGYLGFSG